MEKPVIRERFSPEGYDMISSPGCNGSGKAFAISNGVDVCNLPQQLLKKTFASLREAVFILDPMTLDVLDCNPAVSEMFGYDRDEILGRT